ncbi:hypothetical protein NL676_006671 [Syzygium grande]|nr:hypothetical protein NL676_006671 [Syzygium grande]
MMRLFSPRRTTLLFVIRIKQDSLRYFENRSREDVQPVEFVALSNCEDGEEQFKEEVARLRQQFFHSNARGGLSGDQRGVVPASGFSFSAQQMWKVIKEYKDLDLPAYEVMVATVRCESIAHKKYSSFTENEDWRLIEEASQSGPVPGFGKKLSSILEACLLGKCFLWLLMTALSLIWLNLTKDAQSLGELRHDMDAHVASVRAAKLSELTEAYKEKLNEALSGPLDALLDGANSETWSIVLLCETISAVTGFSGALSGLGMDEQSKEKLLAGITDHARGVVEAQARQESEKVLRRKRDRIVTLFSHDTDLMPRVWTGMEHIRATIKLARSASLRLLSVMAALRLDYGIDHIESTLSVTLLDPQSNATDKSITTVDPLTLSMWEDIPSSETLITTFQLKSLWRQFNADIQYIVNQALAIEEAQRAEASRSAKNQWQSQRAIFWRS